MFFNLEPIITFFFLPPSNFLTVLSSKRIAYLESILSSLLTWALYFFFFTFSIFNIVLLKYWSMAGTWGRTKQQPRLRVSVKDTTVSNTRLCAASNGREIQPYTNKGGNTNEFSSLEEKRKKISGSCECAGHLAAGNMHWDLLRPSLNMSELGPKKRTHRE